MADSAKGITHRDDPKYYRSQPGRYAAGVARAFKDRVDELVSGDLEDLEALAETAPRLGNTEQSQKGSFVWALPHLEGFVHLPPPPEASEPPFLSALAVATYHNSHRLIGLALLKSHTVGLLNPVAGLCAPCGYHSSAAGSLNMRNTQRYSEAHSFHLGGEFSNHHHTSIVCFSSSWLGIYASDLGRWRPVVSGWGPSRSGIDVWRCMRTGKGTKPWPL